MSAFFLSRSMYLEFSRIFGGSREGFFSCARALDIVLSVAHVCSGDWAMSDLSLLHREDVALDKSRRGRKAIMVESFVVIHSSLSS